MELSVAVYLVFLAAVAASRLLELRVSARNRRKLAERGVAAVSDPAFLPMALLHGGVVCGGAAEVILLQRVFVPGLALAMGALVVGATTLRVWAIRTLDLHWNVRVMASTPLGVVSSGPYRFIRHPNYLAVYVELLAIPLIHTAWITALLSAAAHALVLRKRIEVEETALAADPGYRSAMGSKPRFKPF